MKILFRILICGISGILLTKPFFFPAQHVYTVFQSLLFFQKFPLPVSGKLLIFLIACFFFFALFQYFTVAFIGVVVPFQLFKILQLLSLTLNFHSRPGNKSLQFIMVFFQFFKTLGIVPYFLFQTLFLFFQLLQSFLYFLPAFLCHGLIFDHFLTLEILCIFLFAK